MTLRKPLKFVATTCVFAMLVVQPLQLVAASMSGGEVNTAPAPAPAAVCSSESKSLAVSTRVMKMGAAGAQLSPAEQDQGILSDVVRGAEEPEQIPDGVALSLFLTSLAPSQRTALENRRIQLTLERAGFDANEAKAVASLADHVAKTVRAIDQEYAAAADLLSRTVADEDQEVNLLAEMVDLEQKRSKFFTMLLEHLDTRLGVGTAQKLRNHLASHVKPRTLKIPISSGPRGAAPDLDQERLLGVVPKVSFAAFSTLMEAAMAACRNEAGNIAPYCSDGCGPARPCDKNCRLPDESCTTCGQYGNCASGGGGGGGGGGEPSLYTYEDEAYDGETLSNSLTAQTDSGYTVEIEGTVEDPDNGAVLASTASSGSPSASATDYYNDTGLTASGANNTANGDPGVNVRWIVRVLLAGVLKRILSWLTGTKYGTSTICYRFNTELLTDTGLIACEYIKIDPCAAKCAGKAPQYIYTYVGNPGGCDRSSRRRFWPWAEKGSKPIKCTMSPIGFADPSCTFCEDIR